MPELDPDNFLSLYEFFCAFVALNEISLPIKPEHRTVCDELQDAILGVTPPNKAPDGTEHPVKFLVINLPPRIGKTKILEAAACWCLAYFPDSQFIYASYSSDLAQQSLKYIRRTLGEGWFMESFSDLVHTQRADKVTTVHGGTIFAEGTGGTLTGKGAGLKRPAGGFIALDDPAKPEEALSPLVAENLKRWFQTTLLSRRNSAAHCPIIICAQRLAPDDLPGYVLQTYPLTTRLVKIAATDAAGNSRFPETIGTEDLNAMNATRYGRFVRASQYDQEPIAFGGNLIQPDALGRYDAHSYHKWEKRVFTCDTALKAEQHNDHWVIQLWGGIGPNAYLIDQARGHWEFAQFCEIAKAMWDKHTADTTSAHPRFTIEEKAAGTPAIQQLQKAGIPAIGIDRTKDKVTRVHEVLPYVEAGMVFVPRDGQFPWLAGLLTELAQFRADGTAPNDDQVDTFTDGVWQVLGKPRSIFDVLGKTRVPTFTH